MIYWIKVYLVSCLALLLLTLLYSGPYFKSHWDHQKYHSLSQNLDRILDRFHSETASKIEKVKDIESYGVNTKPVTIEDFRDNKNAYYSTELIKDHGFFHLLYRRGVILLNWCISLPMNLFETPSVRAFIYVTTSVTFFTLGVVLLMVSLSGFSITREDLFYHLSLTLPLLCIPSVFSIATQVMSEYASFTTISISIFTCSLSRNFVSLTFYQRTLYCLAGFFAYWSFASKPESVITFATLWAYVLTTNKNFNLKKAATEFCFLFGTMFVLLVVENLFLSGAMNPSVYYDVFVLPSALTWVGTNDNRLYFRLFLLVFPLLPIAILSVVQTWNQKRVLLGSTGASLLIAGPMVVYTLKTGYLEDRFFGYLILFIYIIFAARLERFRTPIITTSIILFIIFFNTILSGGNKIPDVQNGLAIRTGHDLKPAHYIEYVGLQQKGPVANTINLLSVREDSARYYDSIVLFDTVSEFERNVNQKFGLYSDFTSRHVFNATALGELYLDRTIRVLTNLKELGSVLSDQHSILLATPKDGGGALVVQLKGSGYVYNKIDHKMYSRYDLYLILQKNEPLIGVNQIRLDSEHWEVRGYFLSVCTPSTVQIWSRDIQLGMVPVNIHRPDLMKVYQEKYGMQAPGFSFKYQVEPEANANDLKLVFIDECGRSFERKIFSKQSN